MERSSYDAGTAILRISGPSEPPSDLDVWLHIGYGNLNNDLYTFLRLDFKAHSGLNSCWLQAEDTVLPQSPWQALWDVDTTADLDVELWTVSSSKQLAPRFLPSRVLADRTESRKALIRPLQIVPYRGRLAVRGGPRGARPAARPPAPVEHAGPEEAPAPLLHALDDIEDRVEGRLGGLLDEVEAAKDSGLLVTEKWDLSSSEDTDREDGGLAVGPGGDGAPPAEDAGDDADPDVGPPAGLIVPYPVDEVGEGRGRGRGRGGRGLGGRGRGRGRGRGDAYLFENIKNEANTDVVGRILINPGGSLDAHCNRCTLRINRRRFPHPSRHGVPQGRPLGALIAILWEDCDGNEGTHRGKYTDGHLTFPKRHRARLWAAGGGVPAHLLEQEERPARDDEPDGEPLALC